MSDALLSVTDLRTWIDSSKGTLRVVDGINFQIRRGETFALLGESGCGKSMTALSIMQLLPPQASGNMSGEVRLGDQDLLGLPEVVMRAIRGKRIAMIFQEPMTSLNPVLTVGTQIGESVRRHKGLSGVALRNRVEELLVAVGIPEPKQRMEEYPHQLSGGMKQRVMIAMALAGEPELLIADEPTTALDVTIQAQILELLRKLQKQTGMAMLLITHDLGVVYEMADHVAVMYAGHIVEQADRQTFFSQPQHPYTQKLFASMPGMAKRQQRLAVIEGQVPSLAQEFRGCRFADRCDLAWLHCRMAVPRWIETTPGHGVRCHLVDPAVTPAAGSAPLVNNTGSRVLSDGGPRPGQALLEVRDLKVHFPIQKGLLKRTVGHVRAVDGVSLQLQQAHTIALVGESGCGKTTVGKAILQLLRPTSGVVNYAGKDLTQLKHDELRPYRGDLQIIFQDPYSSMNPRLRIVDIIEEGMLAQKKVPDDEDRQERIDHLLRQVGLNPEIKFRYPHEFSGGQRQRICIARALAVEPKVLICDEPTSALDVSVQAQILNLLKSLQNELGLSYLFITHNLSAVEYLAHDVAVMYLGRIVERGTVEEVLRQPKHPYTQALISAVPVIEERGKREIIRLSGELPSPVHPPAGCHFHPRCPHANDQCRTVYPEQTTLSVTHQVHCHLYGGS